MSQSEAVPLRDDFRVAIIRALGLEAKAVEKHFDERWTVEEVDKLYQDDNAYSLGRIDGTLVVLVWMPEYGKTAAATAAKDLHYSFNNIKHVLVVGICEGIPLRHRVDKIVLGDVVISTGLLIYDKGKQYYDAFQAGDATRKTRKYMAAFLNKMSNSDRLRTASVAHLQRILEREDTYAAEARFVDHKRSNLPDDTRSQALRPYPMPLLRRVRDSVMSCARKTALNCSVGRLPPENLVPRRRLQGFNISMSFMIHFGLVGSGDTVMKSGKYRDELATEYGIIAFEMEGAGVCNVFESMLVIKVVCDYADSHKNKKWQPHAAAAAAACTRAFLEKMRQDGFGPRPRSRRGSSSSVSTVSTVSTRNSFARSTSSSSSVI